MSADDHRIHAAGWTIASGIVAGLYRDSGIDVIPIFHPEHGWDRFIITRRITCAHHRDEAPDALGAILLSGADAPRLVCDGVEIGLGSLLDDDPARAIADVLTHIPALDLTGDHGTCWHERAPHYPTIYAAVADLIVGHPDVVAARELYVDDQHLDGTYHPLYLHSVVTEPGLVYDWFSVETPDHSVCIRITGEQAIYQTETGSWRTAGPILRDQDRTAVARQLRAWLRLPSPCHSEPQRGISS